MHNLKGRTVCNNIQITCNISHHPPTIVQDKLQKSLKFLSSKAMLLLSDTSV